MPTDIPDFLTSGRNEIPMNHQIQDFKIYPGDHCGSVAMRGLLDYYCNLKLPEAAVFGLGAGVTSAFLYGPAMDPPYVLFGRTMSMEVDLGRHLGIDYREQPESDDDKAWRIVREEILAGRPTMLSGDIFYLDYRDYKVHFPAHRFILLGFDDEAEQASIGDRIRDEPEICSLGAIRQSRNPPVGMSTQNLWGRFHDTAVGSDLRDAAAGALRQCALGMLSPPKISDAQQSMGLLGMDATRAFAESMPEIAKRPDACAIASFNASCLEKFGNGGGNFRRLYADFLFWARTLDPKLVHESAPALAVEAADSWTAASTSLFLASGREGDEAPWNDAAKQLHRAAEIEQNLFERIAECLS